MTYPMSTVSQMKDSYTVWLTVVPDKKTSVGDRKVILAVILNNIRLEYTQFLLYNGNNT